MLGARWLLFVRRSVSKLRVGSPRVPAAKWLPLWIRVDALSLTSLAGDTGYKASLLAVK